MTPVMTVPEIKDCVFLLSVKGQLDAEAYEEMLLKNGLSVIKELCGSYGTIDYLTSDKAGKDVNLYVPPQDLSRARELVHRFETEQIDYQVSFADDHRHSAGSRLLFAFLICMIVVFPIALGVAILIGRIIRGFN